MKNKVEVYNSILSIYKKSGQGVPYHMMPSDIKEMIDELVEDGLVKLVYQNYSYLPSDTWACLTNCYCVEDSYKDGNNDLTYIRIYRGLDLVIDLGNVKMTLMEAIQNPEIMEQYSKWLSKNSEELKKGDELTEMVNLSYRIY